MINRRRRTTPRTVVRRRRARAASRRRPRARPTTGGAAETRGPVSRSRLGGRARMPSPEQQHEEEEEAFKRRNTTTTDQPPHPSCPDRCCCRSCVWCCWMDGSESEGLLGRFAKAVGLKPAAKEADLGQKMEAYFDKVYRRDGGSHCCCLLKKKCLATHWWWSVGWVQDKNRWIFPDSEDTGEDEDPGSKPPPIIPVRARHTAAAAADARSLACPLVPDRPRCPPSLLCWCSRPTSRP